MKYILAASILLFGCSVVRAPQSTPTVNVVASYSQGLPLGTLVQYQVTTSDQSPIFVLQYLDDQQNVVSLRRVASGWKYSFTTSKPYQAVHLTCLVSPRDTSSAVTAQIFINGAIQKQATGQNIKMGFPN